jgi:serine/threonine-protein kinase
MLLPPDVELVPVEDLSDEVRAQFQHRPGDHAVTRPRARTPSTIVDRNTARLLASFRTPTRIVDAIIAFATEEHLDPRETLTSTYPILKDLLWSGVLVPADSDLARPIGPSLAPGDAIGRFEVVRPIHLMIDTELYLARGTQDGAFAAIKIARPGSEQRMEAMLAREAQILGDLDGSATPRPLAEGGADSRPFLALTWHAGVDADTAAAELRRAGDEGRSGLLEMGTAIIAAYADLHRQGVVHGDVHPSNVIVAADGRVTLIDFGLAARDGDPAIARGGVDFFMDPETIRAQAAGLGAIAPQTRAGEQYGVAALLYFLLTGAHTHDFSLESDEMTRQLLDEPPTSFSRRAVTGLDRVERVLLRALSKEPSARYADMQAFLADWSVARAADGRHGGRGRLAPRQRPEGARLLDETLARLAVDAPLFVDGLVAPTASVNLGAAGIASGLLRIAMARDDFELLALADAWSNRALAAMDTEAAFTNRDLEITPADFGAAGIHHSATGVYAAAAAIATVRGDDLGRSMAISGFVASASEPGDKRDVSFGTAGILLGAAGLLEAAAPGAGGALSIRELGDRLAALAWSELSAPGPIGGERQRAGVGHLGGAHGWGGMLYSQLRWAQATSAPAASGLEERLHELASMATPLRRGLMWPRELGAPDDGALSSSWCNGAAGLVALWTLAARTFPGSGFERLADGAAWTAYDGPSAPGDLCCGLAGRAYALLGAYRAEGDRAWLGRAEELAEHAAHVIRDGALRRDSLYKGEIGVAVLAADLARPDESAMPFWDREPWPEATP